MRMKPRCALIGGSAPAANEHSGEPNGASGNDGANDGPGLYDEL